jgi:hypothetical protein
MTNDPDWENGASPSLIVVVVVVVAFLSVLCVLCGCRSRSRHSRYLPGIWPFVPAHMLPTSTLPEFVPRRRPSNPT